MFNTLYLLTYNNYYNRLVKQETDLTNYMPYVVETILNYNFNPNDHVTTNVIVNIPDTCVADYLLVVDEFDNIDSRWFILDCVRVRSGQYNLTLYRDTVIDYFNVLKNSPCFIEKAIVNDNDNFIFNKEDMTFNQIKTKETLLKDKTNCSWLVAYIAKRNAAGTDFDIELETTAPDAADILMPSLDAWEYNEYVDRTYSQLKSIELDVRFRGILPPYNNSYLTVSLVQDNVDNNSVVRSSYNTNPTTSYVYSDIFLYGGWEGFYNDYSNTFEDVIKQAKIYRGFEERTDINKLSSYLALNGKTIKFADDENLYKINITRSTADVSVYPQENISSGNPLYLYLRSAWPNAFIGSLSSVGPFLQVTSVADNYILTLESLGTKGKLKLNLPSNRLSLSDAPYCMICAPYETVTLKLFDETVESTTEDVMAIANKMITQGGGTEAWLYDIQRLPYCPINSFAYDEDNKALRTEEWSELDRVFPILKDDKKVGAFFACNVSNFSKVITLDEPIIINNPKIESQCDMYRLCSPNYNGVFEFNAAQNGGISYFNVDCSYKPYNPYIQLAPNFGKLYGQDFNDARGLVCGGEWGLPMLTSAWETYERQNANYNTIFNRQIQNMEVVQGIQREQEIWAAVAGTLQGAASGAMIGGLAGGGVAGMIGGGIAGAAISGIAGARDVELNNRLRGEAIDYAKDNFGYQLGNIKALPTSLSRVSAFTITNKIFPFLEYYTCSQEEKDALAYKIAYNGMTVMRIDTLGNYTENSWSYNNISAKNYIKAKLIKCETEDQDYHITNTIAKELNLGLFFKGGN